MPYSRVLAFLVLFVSPVSCLLQAQRLTTPKIDGYVSSRRDQSRFEVDGRTVERTEKTGYGCYDLSTSDGLLPTSRIQLGDHLQVFGKYDSKSQATAVTQLCRVAWVKQKVYGAAVLEKVEGQKLWVDGRLLKVNAATVVQAEQPRHGVADAVAGDWITYTAASQPNGTYVAQELTLAPNSASKLELKLRTAKFLEFTPPDLVARRPGSVKFAHLAPRFPLPADAVAERLNRVGASLIPAYQKALAVDDPLRIDFRFYQADRLKLGACLSNANGVIFVPTKTVERLADDKYLAAVLSTCIADLIEKQPELIAPRAQASTGAAVAGDVVGAFIPGVGLATAAGVIAYGHHLAQELREQSGRVSLDLLAAAGYDPSQAPHAWEVVEAKHLPLKLDAQPPEFPGYLYRALAERQRRGE